MSFLAVDYIRSFHRVGSTHIIGSERRHQEPFMNCIESGLRDQPRHGISRCFKFPAHADCALHRNIKDHQTPKPPLPIVYQFLHTHRLCQDLPGIWRMDKHVWLFSSLSTVLLFWSRKPNIGWLLTSEAGNLYLNMLPRSCACSAESRWHWQRWGCVQHHPLEVALVAYFIHLATTLAIIYKSRSNHPPAKHTNWDWAIFCNSATKLARVAWSTSIGRFVLCQEKLLYISIYRV